MIKKPLFSIVIVNYNYGKFLKQAIESVINQKFNNYELIIIDGGSTDDSVDIIKSFESHISYWISEKDNGQSDAFNKGFSKANGEFYFWLNADDILMPNSLINISNYLNKDNKCKWIAANTVFFNEDNEILRCRRGIKWKDFLIKQGPIYVYGPSTIFHKELYNKANGFDEGLYYTMDTDLWMRFSNLGYKFYRLPKYVWGLRIHNESKTSHAFTNMANPKFEKERLYIQSKNNWTYKSQKIIFQKIYKILSGTYLFSYIDTLNYKNTKLQK
ncbi:MULTISPECIES: glycosyltransferase family 2 protein [Weeksellaceae]|uniref:glycosyltransferase family 2 protein n=1 Tax=Weeksellaceae TaxID=2762318 RepID=UPI00289C3F11|nr:MULTISPECIES: glycosyltransferase family 2 protein [Weeksellaceae]